MKFVRWGDEGSERPGAIDAAGRIRDISRVFKRTPYLDSPPAVLEDSVLMALPVVDAGVRLGPCVVDVHNFIAIGLNYADHASELGLPHPREPVLFSKATTSIAAATSAITLPTDNSCVDWEVELAVVIGRNAHQLTPRDVASVIAGYCICNDISERQWQLERGGQWITGKSFPGFAPLGPWLVTPDEIADVQNLGLWLEVNGERRQSGNTRHMIFSVTELVAYVSQFMRLLPGDVITTGTPAGVGMSHKPPLYLQVGDVVTCGIDGLGAQRQQVVGPSERGEHRSAR